MVDNMIVKICDDPEIDRILKLRIHEMKLYLAPLDASRMLM